MGVKDDCHLRSKRFEGPPLEQLLRSLITHEMMLGDDESKKKKGTALKAKVELEKENEDDDLALLIMKFKQFINRTPFGRKGDSNNQKGGEMIFFKCKNPDHIKIDCCLLKKDKFK